MRRVQVFADESGNFDFSRGRGASRYFILTTVTMQDGRALANDLAQLRYDLAWRGFDQPGPFHAATDKQMIRDLVFEVLQAHSFRFRVDATILDKPKTQPHIRSSEERFYQTAWFYHLRHVAPRIARSTDELFVLAASVGTKKKRAAFARAVADVVQQVSPTASYRAASWLASCDPCLQAADYCCWAIQRKWERNDDRSYHLIAARVASEYDLFEAGHVTYY